MDKEKMTAHLDSSQEMMEAELAAHDVVAGASGDPYEEVEDEDLRVMEAAIKPTAKIIDEADGVLISVASSIVDEDPSMVKRKASKTESRNKMN